MVGFGTQVEDEDVEMAMPQAIYEYVHAPWLSAWSHTTLVRFMKDRKQYEDKIAERCAVTGDSRECVTITVKASIDPRVLEHVSHYIIGKKMYLVTGEDLKQEIQRTMVEW
ncbi:hypothetical protein PINS_up015695 [Pythium insidiosum]|nr:hypothetical protein PINS_up015695 [Pythium insidiosum]